MNRVVFIWGLALALVTADGVAAAQVTVRAPQTLSGIPQASGASIASRAAGETTGVSTAFPLNAEPEALAGMLDAHNAVRDKLGLPGLTWSAELAAKAGETAKSIAAPKSCSKTAAERRGQTAAAAVYWATGIKMFSGGSAAQEISPSFVVSEWQEASASYDRLTGGCKRAGACLSFARMADPAVTTVGCAKTLCDSQAQVWACHYGK
jgi:hypothetical protein